MIRDSNQTIFCILLQTRAAAQSPLRAIVDIFRVLNRVYQDYYVLDRLL